MADDPADRAAERARGGPVVAHRETDRAGADELADEPAADEQRDDLRRADEDPDDERRRRVGRQDELLVADLAESRAADPDGQGEWHQADEPHDEQRRQVPIRRPERTAGVRFARDDRPDEDPVRRGPDQGGDDDPHHEDGRRERDQHDEPRCDARRR